MFNIYYSWHVGSDTVIYILEYSYVQNATASYIVLRLTTYIFFRLRHPKYENGSCDRRISLKFGTDEGDRRNKHVLSAISMTNDPDWYRRADDPSRHHGLW